MSKIRKANFEDDLSTSFPFRWDASFEELKAFKEYCDLVGDESVKFGNWIDDDYRITRCGFPLTPHEKSILEEFLKLTQNE